MRPKSGAWALDLRPREPSSRTAMRDIFILPMKARGRPEISQRLRMRPAAELRGSSASLRRAAKRSSSVAAESSAIAFSFLRRAAYCFTSLIR